MNAIAPLFPSWGIVLGSSAAAHGMTLALAMATPVTTADSSAVRLREAMERYAQGDDAAFGDVYDLLSPRLLAFLTRMTRDRVTAEDLMQQTFLNMHRARGRFAPGAEVVPWAFAIARRLFLDSTRRGKREVLERGDGGGSEDDGDRSIFDLLESMGTPADELVDAKSLANVIEGALSDLPDQQREAFTLIKQEGLSVAEAAGILGTSVGAVKLRAHRAYEALRSVLGKKGWEKS
jgi:RNA polymerase sigma-70 factor (ECF subfamily)